MRQKKKKTPVHTGLPLSDLGRIELVCHKTGEELLITGVRRILLYGRERMSFKTKGGVLVIEGEALDCVIYKSGSVGLVGKVRTLSLARKEGEE